MVTTVFVCVIVEYERGWGCKPDGYLAFPDEKTFEDFRHDMYKERPKTGAAPDYYVNYEIVGYKECLPEFATYVSLKSRVYVDKLSDLNKKPVEQV